MTQLIIKILRNFFHGSSVKKKFYNFITRQRKEKVMRLKRDELIHEMALKQVPTP
jgi:hypothetical protein